MCKIISLIHSVSLYVATPLIWENCQDCKSKNTYIFMVAQVLKVGSLYKKNAK